MTIKELREKRSQLIAEARSVVEAVTTKGEALNAEAKERVDKLRADARALADTIERAEELETEDRSYVPDTQRQESRQRGEAEASAEERNAAVLSALRGIATPEQRRLAGQFEFRDQSTTGSAGGYTIAPDTRFYGQIVEAMKSFGGMLAAPLTVITTTTGADLPIPTNDDTGNVGSVVAEAGSVAGGTDLTLGQITLRAYKVVAPIVKVSIELLQDSEANFAAFLGRQLGKRIARKKNALLTVGTGSSQHQGIAYSGASVGRTCATGFVTTCSADDLLRLKHSVDPEYRDQAGAGYMMNDTSLLTIALLKDGDGQYLLKGLQEGQTRLFAKPIYVNQDMPDMGASAKSVAFGDFSSYFLRNVSGIQIVRLNELYAANQQVGFMGWERSDGALVDAGMHPVRVMVNAAS